MGEVGAWPVRGSGAVWGGSVEVCVRGVAGWRVGGLQGGCLGRARRVGQKGMGATHMDPSHAQVSSGADVWPWRMYELRVHADGSRSRMRAGRCGARGVLRRLWRHTGLVPGGAGVRGRCAAGFACRYAAPLESLAVSSQPGETSACCVRPNDSFLLWSCRWRGWCCSQRQARRCATAGTCRSAAKSRRRPRRSAPAGAATGVAMRAAAALEAAARSACLGWREHRARGLQHLQLESWGPAPPGLRRRRVRAGRTLQRWRNGRAALRGQAGRGVVAAAQGPAAQGWQEPSSALGSLARGQAPGREHPVER
jgi:hypothetical protein